VQDERENKDLTKYLAGSTPSKGTANKNNRGGRSPVRDMGGSNGFKGSGSPTRHDSKFSNTQVNAGGVRNQTPSST